MFKLEQYLHFLLYYICERSTLEIFISLKIRLIVKTKYPCYSQTANTCIKENFYKF